MMAHNNGITLAWSRRGAGDPVLLIHGLGYARWGWEPIEPILAKHFSVITFDNRGIGESDVPAGPYTAAEMAEDAIAVLDAAGVRRAHVVGTSLGGMIAQEVAIAHPERVDRLVLLSTTPGGPDAHPMPEATTRLLTEAQTMAPAEALESFVRNALGPRPDERVVERIMSHRLRSPQDPDGWAAQAAAGTTYDGSGRAVQIGHPTLVVTGDADNVVDPDNAALLCSQIPNARSVLVPGTGHLPFWERPRTVADLIIEFLS